MSCNYKVKKVDVITNVKWIFGKDRHPESGLGVDNSVLGDDLGDDN